MDFTSLLDGRSKFHRVMGIINLNSDSFFPGSRNSEMDQVLRMAERMIDEGVDLLDLGAESSRPGAKPISEEEELDRLFPIIPEIVKRFPVPISIDTYKAKVAERVLDAGAKIINDITALTRDPKMAGVVASRDAGLILMHMRGNPEMMQTQPTYDNVVEDIISFLSARVEEALNAGINSNRIAIDPGIGFGKTTDHNLLILKNLNLFMKFKKPVVLGASRKSFLGGRLNLPVEERLDNSLAAAVIGLMKGATIFRVHDVKETVRVLELTESILKA